MCGRYYVDDETAREIERLICQIDEKGRWDAISAAGRIVAGDVFPGAQAPVLSQRDGSVCCRWQRWGFSGRQGKKLIFNARSESAPERPLFRESVLARRIVVPATWFYEWNPGREKNRFRRKDAPVLFMAGLGRQYEDGEHFVILTTAANASVKPVHDRMPLILEREEVCEWVLDDTRTESILRKVPCLLERQSDYEQMSLF